MNDAEFGKIVIGLVMVAGFVGFFHGLDWLQDRWDSWRYWNRFSDEELERFSGKRRGRPFWWW